MASPRLQRSYPAPGDGDDKIAVDTILAHSPLLDDTRCMLICESSLRLTSRSLFVGVEETCADGPGNEVATVDVVRNIINREWSFGMGLGELAQEPRAAAAGFLSAHVPRYAARLCVAWWGPTTTSIVSGPGCACPGASWGDSWP